ncbi:hypothetical protein PSTEL_19235 [Paenibacillus stellifer]|uniref:Uncharacterized protein n=1 Tax=Paenibacillus stellifer TaxID=169760 RepID=A0A089N848_9BACL|nr:hypothetical protein [Paenibacillus stellifer]AIQ64929.1 hypothetical protein PSTEL_19235 [Paenibacillus stellifer]
MKKKWLLTGSAVGISGTIMLVTGLTAFAGTSGYDDYKSALKATVQNLDSVTVSANAELKDDNTLLVKTQSRLKADVKRETVSGSIYVSGTAGAVNLDLYKQAGEEVWKTGASDTYYVKKDQEDPEGREQDEKSRDSLWFSSQEETVIDALIGNLKDEITSTAGADGTKTISLQLDGAQIPAVVQAMAPLAFKHLSDQSEWNRDDSNSASHSSDPEKLLRQNLVNLKDVNLKDGIQIQSVSLKAVISPDNEISQQQLDIAFTGKDAQGVAHTLTGSLNVQLTGINGTSPDSIDLTGKHVVQVKGEHEGRHRD